MGRAAGHVATLPGTLRIATIPGILFLSPGPPIGEKKAEWASRKCAVRRGEDRC